MSARAPLTLALLLPFLAMGGTATRTSQDVAPVQRLREHAIRTTKPGEDQRIYGVVRVNGTTDDDRVVIVR